MAIWQNLTEKDIKFFDNGTSGILACGLTDILIFDKYVIIIGIVAVIIAMSLVIRWKTPYKHRLFNLVIMIGYSSIFFIITLILLKFSESKALIDLIASGLINIAVIIIAYIKLNK
ncbi:MAG: hypothetical protein Q4B48_07745, partial [Syntrophomonadaceae bacterium]|nr:hypothetical protein [Syntrophomonadaceae bacterium]